MHQDFVHRSLPRNNLFYRVGIVQAEPLKRTSDLRKVLVDKA